MYIDPKYVLHRYKILSRSKCEEYCNEAHTHSSVIISIKSTWENQPNVFTDSTNNVKDILFLTFDDVDREDCMDEDGISKCMSAVDGKNVANFIKKWNDRVDRIIVHCEGGISRSAGVSAAIMRVMEGDDYIIFKNKDKFPNMTCYLNTLKGFGYV